MTRNKVTPITGWPCFFVRTQHRLDRINKIAVTFDLEDIMGKKRKNKSASKANHKFSTSFKDLLEQVPKDAEQPPAKPTKPKPTPTPTPTPSPRVDVAQWQPVDDDALFEQALEQMSAKDVFQGKYMGSGHKVPEKPKQPEPTPVASPDQEAQEAEARERIEALRDEAYFEHMVGPVAKVERGKYRAPNPRAALLNPEPAETRGYTDETPDTLYTPTLPKSGEALHFVETLNDAQRGLLKRYRLQNRRERAPQLNLHGDTQEDALRQLELFMHKAWKDKVAYVRIIHGKGLGSENQQPVLKPTVLHWLEGPGLRYIRGYAPELTQDRNYGSLIVAMDAKRLNSSDH